MYVKAPSDNKLAEISNLITETPDSYWKERTEELIETEKSNITVSPNYSNRSFNRHIFEKVSKDFPDFINKRNLYIESVTKVLTNGEKSRVILVLNSKTDDNFKHTTMTKRNFYLFKVENSWRIFEIMDGGDITDFPY